MISTYLHVLLMVWFYGLAPALVVFTSIRTYLDSHNDIGDVVRIICGVLLEAVLWPVSLAWEVGAWMRIAHRRRMAR